MFILLLSYIIKKKTELLYNSFYEKRFKFYLEINLIKLKEIPLQFMFY